MAYIIKPDSRRHHVLEMADEWRKRYGNKRALKQSDFAKRYNLSCQSHWTLAHGMDRADLVSAGPAHLRMTSKGRLALEILNMGYVYNADTDNADHKLTEKWQKAKKARLFPGQNHLYETCCIGHDILQSIKDLGLEAAKDKYKKSRYRHRHFGRIEENGLSDKNGITERGEAILFRLNMGRNVTPVSVQTLDVTDLIVEFIDRVVLFVEALRDAAQFNAYYFQMRQMAAVCEACDPSRISRANYLRLKRATQTCLENFFLGQIQKQEFYMDECRPYLFVLSTERAEDRMSFIETMLRFLGRDTQKWRDQYDEQFVLNQVQRGK